ncbi:hypothetical protein TWF788_008223 [Orbilia oligospora]|uniref:Uncharacterized protein n=1 Tax=Orbilia oligospora TaxID=2813651 RepID=A0A7C8UAC2_ORBOL|nr:hypothetical protein TWF788_008223 [Orbilia oligospora]
MQREYSQPSTPQPESPPTLPTFQQSSYPAPLLRKTQRLSLFPAREKQSQRNIHAERTLEIPHPMHLTQTQTRAPDRVLNLHSNYLSPSESIAKDEPSHYGTQFIKERKIQSYFSDRATSKKAKGKDPTKKLNQLQNMAQINPQTAQQQSTTSGESYQQPLESPQARMIRSRNIPSGLNTLFVAARKNSRNRVEDYKFHLDSQSDSQTPILDCQNNFLVFDNGFWVKKWPGRWISKPSSRNAMDVEECSEDLRQPEIAIIGESSQDLSEEELEGLEHFLEGLRVNI